jgi:hypothetical protein
MKKFRLSPPSLLIYVNVSIGNESKHLTNEDLVALFYKKVEDYNMYDRYAVGIIQTEAYKKSIVAFMWKYKIPKENVKYVLKAVPIYS